MHPFFEVASIAAGAVAAVVSCAQAQTTTLIFACEGKLTGSAISEDKPEALHNVGLVVNLKDRTVSFGGFVAPFNKVDEANIYFNGTNKDQYGISTMVDGSLDRVTGAVNAMII